MSWKATAFVKEITNNITATEKLILFVLADYHNSQRQAAWPSIPVLARESLVSDRQAYRLLAKLERNGFIRRTINTGQVTEYQIVGLDTPDKMSPPTPDTRCQDSTSNPLTSPLTFRGPTPDIALSQTPDISSTAIRKNGFEQENSKNNPPSSETVLKLFPNDDQETIRDKVIEKAFSYFVTESEKSPAYTLTEKRKKMARSRWAEVIAHSSPREASAMFKKAIDGLLDNDFMQNNGYMDWEQIFGSQEKFQKRIEYQRPEKPYVAHA